MIGGRKGTKGYPEPSRTARKMFLITYSKMKDNFLLLTPCETVK